MSDLAEYVARRIFECPMGVDKNEISRIVFKGGDYEKEVDHGGLCEAALVDVIRNALRAAHKWQPIETAPHTGVAILLWQPWKSGRNCNVIGHYANGWVDRDCEELFVDPTHWMPLPDAPPVDGGGEHG